MDITFLGAGTVKLSGKSINILCDPTVDGVKMKAANRISVVTQSTLGLAGVEDAMVLDGPGEYEVGGAMIVGVGARRHIDTEGEAATMFSILIDGINVVVIGPIAANLTASQLERLGKVDVLVVHVGGHGLTLEPEEATKLVAKLEPAFVIPVHYDDGVTTYEMPQAKVDEFIKEMGVTPEPVARLKVVLKELPTETQVVVLNPVV
jgi:L-ascorbate metabolism protein UlaG (beta-lactamase superfamily)